MALIHRDNLMTTYSVREVIIDEASAPLAAAQYALRAARELWPDCEGEYRALVPDFIRATRPRIDEILTSMSAKQRATVDRFYALRDPKRNTSSQIAEKATNRRSRALSQGSTSEWRSVDLLKEDAHPDDKQMLVSADEVRRQDEGKKIDRGKRFPVTSREMFLAAIELNNAAGVAARIPFVDRWLLGNRNVGEFAVMFSMLMDMVFSTFDTAQYRGNMGALRKVQTTLHSLLGAEVDLPATAWQAALMGRREAQQAVRENGRTPYGRQRRRYLQWAKAFQLHRTPAPGADAPLTLAKADKYLIKLGEGDARETISVARSIKEFDVAFGVTRPKDRPRLWLGAEPRADETCEVCGRRMELKRSRLGIFFVCTGFPECRLQKLDSDDQAAVASNNARRPALPEGA